MNELPYTLDDFILFQIVGVAILMSLPEPQQMAPIPDYGYMSPGVQYLARKTLTEMGYEVRGTYMFNPRFTFWQKIRKSLCMLKPS